MTKKIVDNMEELHGMIPPDKNGIHQAVLFKLETILAEQKETTIRLEYMKDDLKAQKTSIEDISKQMGLFEKRIIDLETFKAFHERGVLKREKIWIPIVISLATAIIFLIIYYNTGVKLN